MAPLAPTIGIWEEGSVKAQSSQDTGEEIEDDELRVTHRIFDVIAENPKVKHVPE
jgi:hypothetical protein